ncbi:MAG: NmrA family NAD(P)-binding protein [Steroidobacteraceae bacterium]|nr:NmrA family NAD(P)-binding protein [Steroidobacteraceae bacterium]
MRNTVTVFAATGTAGSACVEELLRQGEFDVRVLARKAGQQEKSSSGVLRGGDDKQHQLQDWSERGVEVRAVDATNHAELIPALEGTTYLVSCVPFSATESQYPLIWAAKQAGVERFVPSEFGFIYEWEQFWPTDTVHRTMARQKAFIRRVIELAGLDWTIIPAGLWPEYYMLEPVGIMGDGEQKIAWSTGRDVGRIIPHVLAHPASRNAVCPVAATAYCSWNELLAVRERLLGRPVARRYVDSDQWKAAYAAQPAGPLKYILGIGVAATECPEGMPLWANWNALHLPAFRGTALEQLFPGYIEPFAAALQASMQ